MMLVSVPCPFEAPIVMRGADVIVT